MAYSLRCPTCRVKFPWNPTDGMPELCPNENCNSRIGADVDDNVICMPSIRSARTKANDKVYREMEAASEQRAQVAAEMAGVPVSDMADLKITDLRSTQHEGDVAAVPVNNEVSRLIDRGIGGFQGDGAGYGAGVQTGPVPNAGAHMRTHLQNHHGKVTGGAGVSDRPALETTYPDYRWRG